MKVSFRLLLILVAISLFSCREQHLISDRSLRKTVTDDYRSAFFRWSGYTGDLFSQIDTIKDTELREAAMFLTAYLPLSDLATCDADYIIKSSQLALKTRQIVPWGKKVPPELFLNFVLPPRVNNENPDNFRETCSDILADRIKGLDAVEAALEINHWCHEKVTYQGSDIRTSSPLATMLSARGRCGEESTFTVAALRAAGLPARQVYTPRWAHCDDNHAWVEVWIDGRWHYMGACEPEPVLDRGWFTEPARRAMLVHTRTYGPYTGVEPLVKKEKHSSVINRLPGYAITKLLRVSVTDSAGNPVSNAEVRYLLYNYAELYPLAVLKTDRKGRSSLITGEGSIVIWADDGRRFGFAVASPGDTSASIMITEGVVEANLDIDLEAPVIPEPIPGPDSLQVLLNNKLFIREDSTRLAYISTWMRDVSADSIAELTGTGGDRIEGILRSSMGNYREIAAFLEQCTGRPQLAVSLLNSVSEKDLRDTPAAILADHLLNAPPDTLGMGEAFYNRWVLSPRVDNELLSAFRSRLPEIPQDPGHHRTVTPEVIAEWINSNISVDNEANRYATPIIPEGVMRLRTADDHSRDILFVAFCRKYGFAAKLDESTGKPQFWRNHNWQNAWDEKNREEGKVILMPQFPVESTPPEYHIHYTISVITEGHPFTLDYGYGVTPEGLGDSLVVEPGQYMLLTGNRLANGDVLANLNLFYAVDGQKRSLKVKPRELPVQIQELRRLQPGIKVKLTSGTLVSADSLNSNGLLLLWIEPGTEPTEHLISELRGLSEQMKGWQGKTLILTNPARTSGSFTEIIPIPALYAADTDLELLKSIMPEEYSLQPFPVAVVCLNDGTTRLVSQGYTIGCGSRILKSIK